MSAYPLFVVQFVLVILSFGDDSGCIQENQITAVCGKASTYIELSEKKFNFTLKAVGIIIGYYNISIGGKEVDCRGFRAGDSPNYYTGFRCPTNDIPYDSPVAFYVTDAAVMISDLYDFRTHTLHVKFTEYDGRYYVYLEFIFPTTTPNITVSTPHDQKFVAKIPFPEESESTTVWIIVGCSVVAVIIFFCCVCMCCCCCRKGKEEQEADEGTTEDSLSPMSKRSDGQADESSTTKPEKRKVKDQNSKKKKGDGY